MALRALSFLLMTSLALAQGAGVQTIFISRVFPAPGRLALFIANADGSGERPLLTEPGGLDYDATWSPAGDWIAFTSERNGSADLYRVRPDFVYSVSREFVRSCQTPMLVMPDDTPAHPYQTSVDIAALAPKAQSTVFPWREPKDLLEKTIDQVRVFLRSYQP